MEFVNKKTTELTQKELDDISALFENVFEQERSAEVFRNQYVNNVFGTSYHTLMYEDGVLVGHNAGTPGYFNLNGKKLATLNNVDLMIRKDCRGIQGFMFMMKKAWTYYKQQGIQLIYSVPNNNSHPLLVKLKFVKDLANLYTYCLPYRIGGVKPALKFANIFSKLFCYGWVYLTGLFVSSRKLTFGVQRDYESFLKTRWNRSDGRYSFAEVNGTTMVYKIMTYEGIRSAFIIDIYEKSQRNFLEGVKYLLKHENKNFDLILYVGYLPFANPGMVRVPHKYEPKNFNFVATVLNDEGLSEEDIADYMNIQNWDINLADDDII